MRQSFLRIESRHVRILFIVLYSLSLNLVCFAQSKEITVNSPNFGKGLGGNTVYKISTDKDGIISKVWTSDKSYAAFDIVRDGNVVSMFVIDAEGIKRPASRISIIEWEGNRVYLKRDKTVDGKNQLISDTVDVFPSPNVLYRNDNVILQKEENNELKLQFVVENQQVIDWDYSTNTCSEYYLKNGNLQRKWVYRKIGKKIIATHFSNFDDFYGFADEINIEGDPLYTSDAVINVVNKFILENWSRPACGILFPFILLPDPVKNLKNPWEYEVSSFLIERTASYPASNLASRDGLPWASAHGYGIGDTIRISMNNLVKEKLIFVNGFVSEEKPYLFKNNSRVKELQITNIGSGRSILVSVDDGPYFQRIDVSKLVEGQKENVKLELNVISVYPGDKYKDLCIEAIIPDFYW